MKLVPEPNFFAPDVPPQQQKPEYFSSQQCPRGSAGDKGLEGEDGTHISSCSSRTSPASLDAEQLSLGAGKGMVSPWERGSRGAAAEGTCLRDTLRHTLLSCAIGLCKYNAVFIRWEPRAQGWTLQRHE